MGTAAGWAFAGVVAVGAAVVVAVVVGWFAGDCDVAAADAAWVGSPMFAASAGDAAGVASAAESVWLVCAAAAGVACGVAAAVLAALPEAKAARVGAVSGTAGAACVALSAIAAGCGAALPTLAVFRAAPAAAVTDAGRLGVLLVTGCCGVAVAAAATAASRLALSPLSLSLAAGAGVDVSTGVAMGTTVATTAGTGATLAVWSLVLSFAGVSAGCGAVSAFVCGCVGSAVTVVVVPGFAGAAGTAAVSAF